MIILWDILKFTLFKNDCDVLNDDLRPGLPEALNFAEFVKSSLPKQVIWLENQCKTLQLSNFLDLIIAGETCYFKYDPKTKRQSAETRSKDEPKTKIFKKN